MQKYLEYIFMRVFCIVLYSYISEQFANHLSENNLQFDSLIQDIIFNLYNIFYYVCKIVNINCMIVIM